MIAALVLAVFLPATVWSASTKNLVVGSVETINVFAFGTPPENTKTPKYIAQKVVLNEILETVADGALVVNLMDDTQLTMGGSAQLIIDEMVYDPQTKKGNAIYKLAKGSFFYVSGALSEDNIVLDTPVATIGIRGTSIFIDIAPNGKLSVGVVSGLISVTSKSTSESQDISPGQSISVSVSGELSGITQGFLATKDLTIDHKILKELSKFVRSPGNKKTKVAHVSQKQKTLLAKANAKSMKETLRNFSRAVKKAKQTRKEKMNKGPISGVRSGTYAEKASDNSKQSHFSGGNNGGNGSDNDSGNNNGNGGGNSGGNGGGNSGGNDGGNSGGNGGGNSGGNKGGNGGGNGKK